MGCVIRDDGSNMIMALSLRIPGSFSPREAKALTLKEALSIVLD